ncbi:hypothetical protein HMPREF1624_01797 [Sporothrix schenckii ATCC 58251]|uniref:Alcohol acetyltransferase n=1 Tax=Sporothrix schenckii (strain ATCC 58251 / de Perez 2211183) TaxID=1391915 RepID=U7Q8F9_SPOS1|nr:hypothetical protein HMPREF1624_01797 [Sporothrix schenckii ATCC 58251]
MALQRTVLRPLGIDGEDSKRPMFVALPSLDLDDHLECVARVPGLSASEYDELLMRNLEYENARPWPDVGTRSPWRLITYLNTTDGWADLAFAVHHALGDGKSGLAFHSHLLEVLNSNGAADKSEEVGENETVLVFTEPPKLTPSQEELVKFTVSWPFFLGTLWKELGPSWLQSAPVAGPYTGSRINLEPKLKGHLRVFHLTPKHAAALLSGCRAHSITLTALVHGLMMVLFARRFPSKVASSFSCVMPISMRPFIHAPADMALDIHRCMANLVSSHSYQYDAEAVSDGRAVAETDAEDDDKVWRAAAAVGASLKARIAHVTEDNVLGLMAWVSDWHDWWRKQEGKAREGTWIVSNTGSISTAGTAPTSGPTAKWTITRNFYTQSSQGKDSLINVNIGGVRRGEMSFIVAWHHGVVETEFANLFVEDLYSCLERYGGTGHFSVPNRLHTTY